MKKLKRCLVWLVALAMVASVTLRANVCTDPNNPIWLGSIVMDEGGFFSTDLTAIDPDGREGGTLTIGLVGEAIPNLTLSPPVVLDPNTVSFINKVSPCDLSTIDPNRATMVSRVLTYEPGFESAGGPYKFVFHFSDGVGGGSWWYWEITVRPTNRVPFPLDRLQDAGGGE